MRHANPIIVLLLIIIFPFYSNAQNYNKIKYLTNLSVQSPYLDVGGMFIPLSSSTTNFNIGFGYQFKTLQGIGVSFTRASSWEAFNDKFNGFGIDYRMQSKTWWFKNTIGLINNYFPSERSVFHQQIAGKENRYFFRSAIGWIPRGGIVKLGLTFNMTSNGSFETRACRLPPPDCEILFTGNRRVNNLQFYVGIHLPNPSRKSLERSYLKR